MAALADRLFSLFEAGEFAAAVQLFHKDAVIKQHFGPSGGASISVADFEASLAALVAVVGAPKYLNRRVAAFPGGFVEQHTSRLTSARGTFSLEACIVCRTNAQDQIIALEEYLDPSPLAAARPKAKGRRQTKSQKSVPTDKLGAGDSVIVTGASSGIGEEIALSYARRGCSVVLAGRRARALEAVADRCRAANQKCRALAIPTDVSKAPDCVALVERAVAAFGPPARLVLNAGISQNATLLESGPDLVREQLEVNFFGAVNTCAAALPSMLTLDRSFGRVAPRIAVVTSALGLLAAPKNTGYVASKAALHGFFDSLRSEVGAEVSISLVAPGPVNTGILRSLSGPRGTRVALDLDEKTLSEMVSAKEAARLTVEACEAGNPLFVFPPLDKLVALRARSPEQVAKIMNGVYNGMKTTAAKL